MVQGRADTQPQHTDQHVIDTIQHDWQQGMTQQAIAGHLGMATRTLEDWLAKGREELAAYSSGKTDELGSYGRLSVAVGKAYYQFEADSVAIINDGKLNGGNKWIPALAHVTRRNPAEWAERRQVQIESTVTVLHATLPALAEAELLALLQSKLESGRKLLT